MRASQMKVNQPTPMREYVAPLSAVHVHEHTCSHHLQKYEKVQKRESLYRSHVSYSGFKTVLVANRQLDKATMQLLPAPYT